MIHIASVEIHGTSERGDFVGRLEFSPGLQVISGRNSFGKSLAAKSIAWCLGLEVIFGRKADDPTFFPLAVREELDLPDAQNVRVLSSEAQLTIQREDREQLDLTRGVTHDLNKVRITRRAVAGSSQMTLLTGHGSMVDEATGFQRFLFEWLGWPRKKIATFDGPDAYIYLENLAPLFYIEQDEGWTEIQARQIGRYGQQQIRELSVEYILGALDTVDQRVMRHHAATLDSTLHTTARALAGRASQTFLKQGWAVDWSGNGSVKEIEARWSKQTLREALQRDAEIDIMKQRRIAVERLVALRRTLTKDPIDPANMSAAASASQLVVDLKQRRHKLNSELRTLQEQYSESEHLLESLLHRIRTATDVHRLKTTGVGRLAHLECPTCHREHLDIDAFHLTEQTAPEVQAHIEALKRDRALTRRTLDAVMTTIRAMEAQIGRPRPASTPPAAVRSLALVPQCGYRGDPVPSGDVAVAPHRYARSPRKVQVHNIGSRASRNHPAKQIPCGGLDIEFHNAQRTLEDVSASVGPVREQIIRAAANLAAQERSIERLDATAAEIDEIQTSEIPSFSTQTLVGSGSLQAG